MKQDRFIIVDVTLIGQGRQKFQTRSNITMVDKEDTSVRVL